MADDVWAWCETSGERGRTVTVKIRWADFREPTRSQYRPGPIDSRAGLHKARLALFRSLMPLWKSMRLVGVTVSKVAGAIPDASPELDLSWNSGAVSA